MFQHKQNNCMNFPLTFFWDLSFSRKINRERVTTVEMCASSVYQRAHLCDVYKLQIFLSVYLKFQLTLLETLK